MAGMSQPPREWRDADNDDLLELLRASGIDISEVDANEVSADDQLTLPVYPTLGDVPTTLDEGTLVWIADENTVYKETGT